MSAPPSWLRRSPARRQARARIVCVPHAGGSSSTFSGWTDGLPDDVELLRAQLPGLDADVARAPFTVRDVASILGRETAEATSLPCLLYGHSLGALVVFELARALRRHHARMPRALVVSGRRAPQVPLSHLPLHARDDQALVEYLRRMGGTDERLLARAAWRLTHLPALRAGLRMSETYVHLPETPLPLPIYAFRGQDDAGVTHQEMAAWSEHTSAAFVMRTLTGGHFFDRAGQATLLRTISGIIVEGLDAQPLRVRPRP